MLEQKASYAKAELPDVFSLQGKFNSEPVEVDGQLFDRGRLLFEKFRGALDQISRLYEGFLTFFPREPAEGDPEPLADQYADLNKLFADEPEPKLPGQFGDDETEDYEAE